VTVGWGALVHLRGRTGGTFLRGSVVLALFFFFTGEVVHRQLLFNLLWGGLRGLTKAVPRLHHIRMHYGHPDMTNAHFVRKTGGVSRGSTRVNVNAQPKVDREDSLDGPCGGEVMPGSFEQKSHCKCSLFFSRTN